MKKWISVFIAAWVMVLAGCFDVIQETTLKQDGSGVITTAMDMSSIMEMLAQMGGVGDEKIEADSSLQVAPLLDSIQELTPEEKELLRDATAHIRVNSSSNKFLLSISTPFTKAEDISKIKAALGKAHIMEKAIDNVMNKEEDDINNPMEGAADDFKMAEVDDYFTTVASKGLFRRTLIKEKYDSLSKNELMQKMKEGLDQGMPPIKFVFLLSLPSPAKKAEGKNVVLSEDKKKIKIENTLDELFADPSRFEFAVEY